MEIETKISISEGEIENLICDALEGGANYWYFIEKREGDPKLEFYETPLREGCALYISDKKADDPRIKPENAVKLDRAAVEKGLQIMANQEKRHFADFISGNYDGTTADVFLQCCIFGDVIYG